MDSKPDDHDPDRPPVGSAEDLEEALRWLEELTARQSKSTDLSNPVPPATLDSPFRGLIDDAEGDLPDWLREAPATPADDSYTEADAESRLDWLAKMAQRESIEELPTLEWRRLSEPVRSAIIARDKEVAAEAPDTTPAAKYENEPVAEDEIESVSEDETESIAETFANPQAEIGEITPPGSEAAGDYPDVQDDVSADWLSVPPPSVAPDAVAVAEEEFRLEIEAQEELPPLDDLDAAMAWIEELAASQDAPIEDIPSVADRALASKLMMEAGISPQGSVLDELGSDSGLVEGLTPTHPFIEEEDFADTVVLVETIAAEQGLNLDEPESGPMPEAKAIAVTPPMPATPGLDEFVAMTDTEEASEALSFEDAMAILDEIAVAHQVEDESTAESPAELPPAGDDEDTLGKTARDLAETITVGASSVAIIESTDEDSAPLWAEDAPWNGTPDDAPGTTEPPVANEEFDADQLVAPPVFEELDDTSTIQVEPEAAESEQPQAEPEDELAWDELPDEELLVEPEVVEAVEPSIFEPQPTGLEEALMALDALALPAGRTLGDVDARLQTAQLTPWRDVASALNWLEAALAAQPLPVAAALHVTPDMTPEVAADVDGEAGWFDRMPEDPDAVLAWLEQMAAAEGDVSAPPASETVDAFSATGVDEAGMAATTAAEIGEADLLAMPEDPDEAMAWLESLAHGGPPAALPVQVMEEAEAEEEPEPGWPAEEEVAAAVESPEEMTQPGEEGMATPFEDETEMPQPSDEVAIAAPEGAPLLDEVANTSLPAEEVLPEDQVLPVTKKRRGRPRKAVASPAPADAAPAEPVAGPEETAAEPPPTAAKPRKSWVDLLKPLD